MNRPCNPMSVRRCTSYAMDETDTELFDFERQILFSKNCQYVGHQQQLNKTGDVIHTVIAGNPILLIKTKDDGIKGFFNVCKHRGGPLAVKKGTTNVLQCQYHGWTYLTNGSFRGVPDWNLVELFNEKNFGLEPVELSFWDGLIFARINPSGISLKETVQGIAERIAPISMSHLQFYREDVYNIACNWKVYVDNYLEGYHIPIVHPELATYWITRTTLRKFTLDIRYDIVHSKLMIMCIK